MDYDIDLLEEPIVKGYSVIIDESLYKRLEKHIRILKRFEHKGLTKHKWIMDAITSKLEKEERNPSCELPKNRYLVLKLNDPVDTRINSKVNLQKKFRSYSKKQWIIEAICEKLEAEEQKAKRLINEISD